MAETETTTTAVEENGENTGALVDEDHAIVRRTTILHPARYGFADEQVEAIKRTVAKDTTDAELVMFLEVCARYDLDPFAKQVFAAKIRGAMQIIISRDGLLAHAHKQGDLQRFNGDVVHENDEFEVAYRDGQRHISHVYGFAPRLKTPGEGEGKSLGRGEIVGAWAEVERAGQTPTFYFAYLSEYTRSGDTPWKSHPSAMILKVAETYALRKAYSVSGVVGEEEIERERTNLTAAPDDGDFGDDPELAKAIKTLLAQAREIDGAKYRPARVRAILDGADQDARRDFAAELEAFVEAHPLEGEVVNE